ncbi:MAG TPA: hypothetical protein VFI00_17105 [Kribbella sp.]|nr:hypothetical protein [Kribbella sp.]
MAEVAIFIIIMIVLSVIGKLKQRSTKSTGTPSPRVQKLIEKIQAQQGGNQPVRFQGQYTHAAGQTSHAGTAPGSQQVAAALQQSMQAGRQPRHLGERTSPGQSNRTPAQSGPQVQPAATWLPSNQPPAHRPPQNNLPAAKQDLDARVLELMRTRNEVGAIRLLCDERDLGILDAQEYARTLVAPTGTKPSSRQSTDAEPEPDEEDSRYVGSAAFAESIFDLDREENVWASGWVDDAEPDDRSDIDELWQTVRNPPRPGATPAS